MALLRIIWQFPQVLLGIVLRLYYCGRIDVRGTYKGVRYFVVHDMPGGGISLGNVIFARAEFERNPTLYKHEYGHTRQSLYLGPLYLLVIGLPSLIHAALYRPEKGNYYDFYTERWADRLGGVRR